MCNMKAFYESSWHGSVSFFKSRNFFLGGPVGKKWMSHIPKVFPCTWSIKQSNKRYSLPRRKENRETWRLHGHWIQMRVRLSLQSHKGMRLWFLQKKKPHASLSVIHFSVLYNWPNRFPQLKKKKKKREKKELLINSQSIQYLIWLNMHKHWEYEYILHIMSDFLQIL